MPLFSIRSIGENPPFALTITRRRGKYIRLSIESATEVKLTLPWWASQRQGLAFVEQKKAWLQKVLAQQKTRENKGFLFQGNEYALKLVPEFKAGKVAIQGDEIHIGARNQREAKKYFQEFLRREAHLIFSQEMENLSQWCGLPFGKLSIRAQKTRWGSCSAQHNISLNIALLRLAPTLREYVLIHELCHTKEMNHSAKFWRLVESYCPDHKNLRKKLRQIGLFQLF